MLEKANLGGWIITDFKNQNGKFSIADEEAAIHFDLELDRHRYHFKTYFRAFARPEEICKEN